MEKNQCQMSFLSLTVKDKKYINSSILRQSTFLAYFGVISRPRNPYLLYPLAEKNRL